MTRTAPRALLSAHTTGGTADARLRPFRRRIEGSEPLSAINTTPLIDVMLVLLIMIILTVPLTLNKVPLDLPQPGPAPAATVHVLAIDRIGQVTVDGETLAEPALTARLKRIATVGDTLTVQTDPEARYDRFAQTLATVRRSGVSRLGFANRPADVF